MKELKRCPFCGSIVEIISNGIGDYFVQCKCCNARTSDINCEVKEYAIQRWNDRNERYKNDDFTKED